MLLINFTFSFPHFVLLLSYVLDKSLSKEIDEEKVR